MKNVRYQNKEKTLLTLENRGQTITNISVDGVNQYTRKIKAQGIKVKAYKAPKLDDITPEVLQAEIQRRLDEADLRDCNVTKWVNYSADEKAVWQEWKVQMRTLYNEASKKLKGVKDLDMAYNLIPAKPTG